MLITLDDLRRFAVAHSLFPPTTLKRALHRLGFVQADPIRAPARAQDLTLRHRVRDYRAGDLERRYVELGLRSETRPPQAGLRAGRPDPGAGPRSGPDAAPSRQGLPCRRPRTPLRGARPPIGNAPSTGWASCRPTRSGRRPALRT